MESEHQAQWKPPYAESPKVVGEYHDNEHYGYTLVSIDENNVTVEWRAIAPEYEGKDRNSTAAKIGVLPMGWQTLDSFSYQVD